MRSFTQLNNDYFFVYFRGIWDSIQYCDAFEWSQKPDKWNQLRSAAETTMKWGEKRFHVICARVLIIVKFCGFCTSTHDNDRDGESWGQKWIQCASYCSLPRKLTWWRQPRPREAQTKRRKQDHDPTKVPLPLGVITPASLYQVITSHRIAWWQSSALQSE